MRFDFSSLLFPYPQFVRHLGYLDEAKAMRKRYQRNRIAWEPHLDRTRSFVLSSAAKCRDRTKIIVLGSGILIDLPLQELSAMFEKVLLLDIVHLPTVRRQVKAYRNVRLITHDVTNTSEKLHGNVLRGIRELPNAAPQIPAFDHGTGLVVSLNILSQLWVIPREFALSRMRELDAEAVAEWCRQLVESHYIFLRSLSCPVCLVADYAYLQHDRSGNIASRGSTIFGLVLPEPIDSWTWDIVPGGDKQFLSKKLNVGAWNFGIAS